MVSIMDPFILIPFQRNTLISYFIFWPNLVIFSFSNIGIKSLRYSDIFSVFSGILINQPSFSLIDKAMPTIQASFTFNDVVSRSTEIRSVFTNEDERALSFDKLSTHLIFRRNKCH